MDEKTPETRSEGQIRPHLFLCAVKCQACGHLFVDQTDKVNLPPPIWDKLPQKNQTYEGAVNFWVEFFRESQHHQAQDVCEECLETEIQKAMFS